MMLEPKDGFASRDAARFATTHWSVVLAAGDSESPDADQALARLCEHYWYPLYAFARRTGHNAPDAQDLTQGFFARLLERRYLADATPTKGRFRSFLLAAFKHYLANEWDRQNAQRRGGGCHHFSLDGLTAEDRFQHEPAMALAPEVWFDHQWAVHVVEQAVQRLHREFIAADKAALFGALKVFLGGEKHVPAYADLARQFAMTDGALKVTVHRMRQRFRELIRDEVSHTVVSPDELEQELRYLFQVLSA
jgi:DNA-directed RNA polymerase specialized sigma24 family protein